MAIVAVVFLLMIGGVLVFGLFMPIATTSNTAVVIYATMEAAPLTPHEKLINSRETVSAMQASGGNGSLVGIVILLMAVLLFTGFMVYMTKRAELYDAHSNNVKQQKLARKAQGRQTPAQAVYPVPDYQNDVPQIVSTTNPDDPTNARRATRSQLPARFTR